MARISHRTGKKGPIWYADYAVDGRRVRKRLGRSKKLAELALADIEVKLERKELGFAAKDRRLQDFIAEYLNYAKGNKAPKSYERDVFTLKHFTEFMQVDKLSAVTAAKLEAYKSWRREGGAKPSTLNRELNTIKAMFNKAAVPLDLLLRASTSSTTTSKRENSRSGSPSCRTAWRTRVWWTRRLPSACPGRNSSTPKPSCPSGLSF